MASRNVGIEWIKPPSELARAVEKYGDKVWRAVEGVANDIAKILESSAKANGPWNDRTGNARAMLKGSTDVASEMVTIYLVHGVEYGVWLETRWSFGGRYAVIWKTISSHIPTLMSKLQAILR